MYTSKTPKVFISYAWDSKLHKKIVRSLADTLRITYGIDVIGDFYDEDNPPGGLITNFMESKIPQCDKVICVLTPTYKIKANEVTGGVGYEKSIITDELYRNMGSSKFIPVILSTELTLEDCAPQFLTSTRRALLRSSYETEELLIEEIARAIHEIPKKPKPPIGKNKLLDKEQDNIVSNAEKIDISVITESQNHKIIFENALHYAKSNDEANFRLLFKKVKEQVFMDLIAFQEKYKGKCLSQEKLDNLINLASPLFLIALSGCLSFKEKFNQQEGLLIDLLSSNEWNEFRINHAISELLAYVYHHIYGALSIDIDQLDNLVKLLEQKIPLSQFTHEYEYLYKVPTIVAWIELIDNGNCFIAFKYLLGSYQKWDWIRLLFNNENEFKKLLVCYQKTMNIFDYFNQVKTKNLINDLNNRIYIPPTFTIADRPIQKYANTLIIKKRGFFKDYLKQNNIAENIIVEQWPMWLKKMQKKFTSSDYMFFNNNLNDSALLMKNIVE